MEYRPNTMQLRSAVKPFEVRYRRSRLPWLVLSLAGLSVGGLIILWMTL